MVLTIVTSRSVAFDPATVITFAGFIAIIGTGKLLLSWSQRRRTGNSKWPAMAWVMDAILDGVFLGVLMSTFHRVRDGNPWMPNVVIYTMVGLAAVIPMAYWNRRRAGERAHT